MRSVVSFIWLLAVGLAVASACSDGSRLPRAGLEGNGATPGSPRVGPCESGAVRECTVTLGENNGILSCFSGRQRCEGGTWSECGDGERFTMTAPSTGSSGTGLRPMALSIPQDCDDNPCDPYCRAFVEQPDAAILPGTDPSQNPPYEWRQGSFGDYSQGSMDLGRQEPCAVAADCQMNTRCEMPEPGACAHHPCEVGVSLVDDCNPCVADICAEDASCCYFPEECAHDPCATGPALASDCDPCVTAVCQAEPGCCTGSWDASCVLAIQTECAALDVPQSCECATGQYDHEGRCYLHRSEDASWSDASARCQAIGDGWDLVTIGDAEENAYVDSILNYATWIGATDSASEGDWRWVDGTAFWSGAVDGGPVDGRYSNWNTDEPNDYFGQEDCAEYVPFNDDWNDFSCSQTLDSLCEGPGTLSAPGDVDRWTAGCVDRVRSVCGASCGAGSPPPSTGSCEPWRPGEQDAACDSFDLAVAPTCAEGGTSVIPVCNHGTREAPAGIRLVHLPAGQIGAAAPDLTGAVECATSEPVPPGRCVEVTDCSGLSAGREILVNPRDGSENPDECRFDDNWSIYEDLSCGAPSCSGDASRAAVKPVNMMFVVDRSGSMDGARWQATIGALKSFYFDPNSAGIGVALRFFPEDVPTAGCNDTACSAEACADPRVPLGELTTDFAPADSQEEALFSALDSSSPGGSTPMHPALNGALSWAVEQQQAMPAEQFVVVLVTDGEPNGCNESVSDIAGLAANAYDTYGVRTYTVGIQGVSTTTIESIAAAGGGQAFFASGSGGLSGELLSALRSIAGDAVSCEFSLDGSGFDPAQARATFTHQTLDPGAAAGPYCRFDLGEVEWGNSCYFHGTDSAKSLSTAQSRCRARGDGWDLVAIGSASENAFVGSLVGSQEVWIGLTDQDVEGTFAWTNGNCFEGGAYENFADGQPDDGGCGFCASEDCVRMDPSGTWSDRACSYTFMDYEYVCEGPTEQPPGACASGQAQGPDGGCYVLEDGPATWSEARAACQARGPAWDLAVVDNQGQNDFLSALIGCDDVWIGTPGSYDNFDPGSSGTECPRLLQNGLWHDEACDTALAYACKGPQLSPDDTTRINLSRVDNEGACASDADWYYDDPDSPSSVSLCPATCDRVRGHPAGRLSIDIGCLPPPPPFVTTRRSELYASDCKSNESVQWESLTWEAATPGDSKIVFSVRAAPGEDELADAAFRVAGTAAAAPENTQICAPGSDCAVNLFDFLGRPDATQKVVELAIDLVPSSTGEPSQINDWEVTFSCPPGE